MLGEGIVSFGVWDAEAVSARKRNASAKIGSGSEIRSATRAAEGVNSMSPSSEWNFTDRWSWTLRTPPSW